MDLEKQQKISKLMIEQSEKLAIARKALKNIKKLQVLEASKMATDALREMGDHGKDPESL